MLDELGWQSIDGLQQKNAVVDLPPLVLREGRHKRLEVSAICAYPPFHRKDIESFRIMQLYCSLISFANILSIASMASLAGINSVSFI